MLQTKKLKKMGLPGQEAHIDGDFSVFNLCKILFFVVFFSDCFVFLHFSFFSPKQPQKDALFFSRTNVKNPLRFIPQIVLVH